MGPVNWIAVAAGWAVAAALGILFYGRKAMPVGKAGVHLLAAVLLAVSTIMIGHMLARVGVATLQAKPWLYFMMTGGLALTFIGPALIITAVRRDADLRAALYDWSYWLTAYLAIGGTFLLLD